MRKLLLFVLVALLLAVLVFPAVNVADAAAAWTCPTVANAYAAQLDITDGSARHYLIDPLAQAIPAQTGNVIGLQFASKPDRWLIGTAQVAGPRQPLPIIYRYHISYTGPGAYGNFQPVGETWIGSLAAYPNVYLYFVMPVRVTGIRGGQYVTEWTDHPNCGMAPSTARRWTRYSSRDRDRAGRSVSAGAGLRRANGDPRQFERGIACVTALHHRR